MDQFTKMQLKQANIKHVSAMIEENELDFSEPLCDLLEDLEFRAAVRGQELKEFSDDELNKLAMAYKDLAGKTMSVQNANKLRKLFDRIPDSSLDKLRRKKIPFLSGLALSRMIQKKMPVRESAWEEYADFEGVEPIQEADLTKSQTKKVHKMADKLPKKDFIQRYGKDGDSVRYATATNMIKKKMGIGESKFKLNKGELKMSESYKERFDSAMGHLGISSLGELNPEDQKPFFAFVDDLKEGLSAAQKKLPPALQKAIMKKMKDKKEDLVGGQKKLDKDKDGDLDAKDFAMLRKGAKKEMMMKDKMKKEEALGQEPMKKMKAPMPKEPDTTTMKDAPKAKEGMKAVVKTKQVSENKRYLQTKPGSLEEAVLISRGLVKKSLDESTGKFYQYEWVSGFKDEEANRYNFDGHMILVEVQSPSESSAKQKAIEFYKANLSKVLKPGKRMTRVTPNKPTHEDYDTKSISGRLRGEKFYPNNKANPKIVYLEDVEPGVLSY